MRIGLALPHYDFSFPDHEPVTLARVVDYACRAEALGFDSVWVSDHLFLDLAKYGGPPDRQRTPEALGMMGAIAAATKQVRIGSLVLCAPFRNPVVLAASARTLHEASGGRVELGLGAGWYEPEFDEAGIRFGTTGERITAFRRYAGVVREHLPDGPPIWVGGKGGPRIARIVAEHADGWNVVWTQAPGGYRGRVETLEKACATAGRDPNTVRRSIGLSTLLGTDPDDLSARYAALQAWTPGGALDGTSLEDWATERLVGTPETCGARIGAFAELGVEEIILGPGSLPFSVYDDEQLALIAEQLLPRVRG